MKIPKLDWISFNPDNPPVVYYMVVATAYGSYLDNFWDTTNDWCEGNDIHVIAYCYLGGQIKVEQIDI